MTVFPIFFIPSVYLKERASFDFSLVKVDAVCTGPKQRPLEVRSVRSFGMISAEQDQIQDHSNQGALKEQLNPLWTWLQPFL